VRQLLNWHFTKLKMSICRIKTLDLPTLETSELPMISALAVPTDSPQKIPKQTIRTSLQASTLDGVFAAIFSSITSGVLLTNFLLQLDASSIQIGMLSSLPMLVNLLQPVGVDIADRTTSRLLFGLRIFLPARLLWLILVLGIGWIGWSRTDPHQLVSWTLGMVFASCILNALGSASWFSWIAALVPPRLRGRYFGFRNSAASLTNLIGVPLLGFAVSAWPGGTTQGYAVVMVLGVLAGLISLGCQFFMVDVNPQLPQEVRSQPNVLLDQKNRESQSTETSIFRDTNFLMFLLYFGLWMFAVNLSAPFFNLYLLDNLDLNLNSVTLYTSLAAAANLVMLLLWGRLADRLGNRPLLLLVGILVAVTPLCWLGTGADAVSVWLWLPLIHLLTGGTGAAIDLCNNNMQMEVAPVERPAKYFATAAAVAGVCGGLGTTAGGFLVQLDLIGGLPGLFALSSVVRLIALLPLFFVREPRSQPLIQAIGNILGFKHQSSALVPAVVTADPTE
jgi:MFS family permease